MTLKQFRALSQVIAARIVELGGDPKTAKGLRFDYGINVPAREVSGGHTGLGLPSIDRDVKMSNITLSINGVNNPLNPTNSFRSLMVGKIALRSNDHATCDLTDFRFDTRQMRELKRQIGLVPAVVL